MRGLAGLIQRCQNKFGWTQEFTYRAVAEYVKFFELKKNEKDFFAEKFSPSFIIDQVWHMHLLDNRNYNASCGNTLNEVIGHDPDGGLEQSEFFRARRYARTFEALSDDSQKQTDIWEKPKKYVRLVSAVVDVPELLIPYSEKLTHKKIEEKVILACQNKLGYSEKIAFKEKIAPFATLRWFVQPRKSRKRTRSERQKYQIFVRFQKTHTFNVYQSGSDVHDLMIMIADKLDISVCSQRLLYNGRQLDESESLAGIGSEATIHLLLALRGC